jgi:hypothetical protein
VESQVSVSHDDIGLFYCFVQVQCWDQSEEIFMSRKASFKYELWGELTAFFQNLIFILKYLILCS